MKIVKPMSRSVYKFRYPVKGSFNLGEICPIGSPIEVIPYDGFTINIATVLRMATPIAPIMDDLDAEITAHFVPLRLIGSQNGDITANGPATTSNQPSFEKLIGNGLGNPADWQQTNHELYSAPTRTWKPVDAKATNWTSIGEALGLGLGIGSTSRTINVLAYPLFGYNLIYDTRFRNENVEASKSDLAPVSNLYGKYGSPTDNSDNNSYKDYNQCLSVAYKHGDYFTNAFPSPTKGAEVTLNLGTQAPLMAQLGTAIPSGDSGFIGFNASGWGTSTPINLNGTNAALKAANDADITGGTGTSIGTVKLYTDLTAATASTINDFILSYNIQRLLMNDIKGTRYYEVVMNHFGVKNNDIELYIPELLNYKRFAINISPVVQQSGAAAATSGTDQGNYLGTTGAYSFTAHHDAMVKKDFGEFGYIYFLIVIRQRRTYGQGIPALYNRRTRFDFFFPELGRIGYQEIKNSELDALDNNTGNFGYKPAWQELRDVGNGQCFGILNPNKANALEYWTLTEELVALPQLEMAFLKEDRTNLARALTIGDEGPDFIMDAMIYGTKTTLVPIGTEPKLFN